MGKGFWVWNGAMLVRDTAHRYLHIIEEFDYDMFMAITSEMIDENIKGHLDNENLKQIDDILKCFEREYSGTTNEKGNLIIREEYTRRLLKQN